MPARQKVRRRAVRPVHHVNHPAKRSLGAALGRAAVSKSARTAYIVIGTAGLLALVAAVVGPRRIRSSVLKPLADAIEPRAEALWSEARPLRKEIADLFNRTAPQARENLARHFQSWIGHFRAT